MMLNSSQFNGSYNTNKFLPGLHSLQTTQVNELKLRATQLKCLFTDHIEANVRNEIRLQKV